MWVKLGFGEAVRGGIISRLSGTRGPDKIGPPGWANGPTTWAKGLGK
jgi:hypothetical protein